MSLAAAHNPKKVSPAVEAARARRCKQMYDALRRQHAKRLMEQQRLITLFVRSLATDSQKQFFKEANEKDYGQQTTNVHILARRQYNSNLPVTPEIINTLLKLAGTPDAITEEHLRMFERIIPVELGRCPLTPEMAKLRLQNFWPRRPDANDPRRVAGSYVFTHIHTGKQVVGSSLGIAERSHQHIRGNTKGAVGKAFAEMKLKNFTLTMYPLPKEYHTRPMHLALEQWLIFKLKPTLNILLVANSTELSETDRMRLALLNRKTAYLYHNGVLVHSKESLRDLSRVMRFNSDVACNNIVNNYDGWYMRELLITTTPIEEAPVNLMTEEQVYKLVEEVRQTGKRTAPRSPRNVTHYLISAQDGTTWQRIGTEEVQELLREKLGHTPSVHNIRNRSKSGDPYYGFTIARKPKAKR